jgi:hypothetical protein
MQICFYYIYRLNSIIEVFIEKDEEVIMPFQGMEPVHYVLPRFIVIRGNTESAFSNEGYKIIRTIQNCPKNSYALFVFLWFYLKNG